MFQLFVQKWRVSLQRWLGRPLVFGTLLGLLSTATFLSPILRSMSSKLTSYEDGLLIGWTVDWVSQSIITLKNPFDAPFLFPYRDTLAFSQLFLPTGLLNIPLHALGLSIVTQQNIHILLGSFCMWMTMYVLMHYITHSKTAATLSSLIFVWSPFHLTFIVHLHAYLLAGIPLAVYGLLRYKDAVLLKRPSRVNPSFFAWVVSFAFLYQALNDPHTAFFTLAVLTTITIADRATIKTLWQHKQHWVTPLLFVVTILAIFYYPYLRTSANFEYTRSIRDAAHFSYSLNRVFMWDSLLHVALILGMFLFQKSARGQRPKENAVLRGSLAITLIGAILMLGPVLKWNDQTVKALGIPIPLPYAALYYLVPGFNALRAATRWMLVANTGIALLSGVLLSRLSLSTSVKIACIVVLTGIYAYAHSVQFALFDINTKVPAIYTTVKKNRETTLVELPLFHWDMAPFTKYEADRLIYQRYHQKKLYNGITGFTPPARIDEIVKLWHEFPSQYSLDIFRNAGIKLLLVHYDQYDEMSGRQFAYDGTKSPTGSEVRSRLELVQGITEVSCQENACLYELP